VRYAKRQLLDLVETEYMELDRLLSRMTEADWTRPVPRSETDAPWTVKDAVAHIVHWKHLAAERIAGRRRSAEERGLKYPAINSLVYERWRDRPPADVHDWHRRVHRDVMSALAAKPEAWFSDRERGPDWLADLRSHSAGHRRRDLEAVLEKGQAGRA
jgi:hypothetical protein